MFGLDLKTDHYEKEIGNPVRRTLDDGAVETFAAVGGNYFQEYDNVLNDISQEHKLIGAFREAANCPEVDDAIEEIINDAIVYPKGNLYPVKLELSDVEMSQNIKDKITDEFEYILSLMDFDTKAHIWFKKWYIDGRLPFYIDTEQTKKLKSGIDDLVYIDPINIKKIRNITIGETDDGVEIIKNIEEMYIYVANNFTNDKFIGRQINTYNINGEKYKGTKLSPDAVVYVTSGLMNNENQVLSWLYKALKPANQMNELEEALVIYRLARAPSRRVFYVDVGNLPTQKAESYLSRLIGTIKNKMSYDTSTGKMSSDKRQKSMLEDIYLPRREGGKGTEVSTIEGSDTFSNVIDEVQYFKHKLYTALKVPISRLDADTTFSFGRDGEITRNEVKFSKFINHLRLRFSSDLFNQLLKTQGVTKKIFTSEEWNDILEPNLTYVFEEDSYFTELKQLDVLKSRVETLSDVDEFSRKYYSEDYIKKKILFQTDEEIEQYKKEREEEQKERDKENDPDRFDPVFGPMAPDDEEPEPEPEPDEPKDKEEDK